MNHLKDFYNKTRHLAQKVVYGTNELPPNVKQVLSEVGDAVITGADIGRTPVQAVITGIIKIVASTPYDKLFHLFIILHTTKGDVVLEKNSRINMTISKVPSGASMETIHIPSIQQGLTVQELINNTATYMGANFIPYSASHNNCQDFILGVLKSNHMDTPELIKFVKQDTTEIFKNPMFRKFANTVTDIAGRANILFQGGELHHRFRFKNNELNNVQIDILMRRFRIPYNGIYIADQMPSRLLNGCYIVNLNGHSHWTGLIKNGNKYFYFDSFGVGAPESIEEMVSRDYVWNDQDIQDMASSSCGWFVICWMRMMHNDPTEKTYKSFIKLFNKKNNDENEAILGGLLC